MKKNRIDRGKRNKWKLNQNVLPTELPEDTSFWAFKC